MYFVAINLNRASPVRRPTRSAEMLNKLLNWCADSSRTPGLVAGVAGASGVLKTCS